jgi:hypothetical protein
MWVALLTDVAGSVRPSRARGFGAKGLTRVDYYRPIFQCRLFSMTPYLAEPRGAAGGRTHHQLIISVRRWSAGVRVRPQPKSLKRIR